MAEKRVWEIDFVRAVAIICMVIFHLLFDLVEYLNIDVPYWDSLIVYISNGVVFFMFISAISSGFSKHPVQRGAIVFAIGMGITVVTYLLMPDVYVRFGILHFLGVSMMLFPLLKKLNNVVLAGLAVLSLVIGIVFQDILVDTWVLLPFGLRHSGFNSIDYYPLFPYLSATILGVIAYKKWYVPKLSVLPFNWDSKVMRWISKHSLAIYLVHQPIILGIIYLVNGPFGL